MVCLFSRIHSDIINSQLRDFRFPLECALWGCWENGCTILSISEGLVWPSAEQGLASGLWGMLHLRFSTPTCTLNWLSGGAEKAQHWCHYSVKKHLSLPSRLYTTTKAQNCTDTRTCTDRLVPSLSHQNACMCDFLQRGSCGEHLAAIASLRVGWKNQREKSLN